VIVSFSLTATEGENMAYWDVKVMKSVYLEKGLSDDIDRLAKELNISHSRMMTILLSEGVDNFQSLAKFGLTAKRIAALSRVLGKWKQQGQGEFNGVPNH
jgi:hypothetical protein